MGRSFLMRLSPHKLLCQEENEPRFESGAIDDIFPLGEFAKDSHLSSISDLARCCPWPARDQNPLGPNTLIPSFFSIARPNRYFISGPS